MEPNVFTLTLLPIVLTIIMLGLGLSLSIDDFKRVVTYPKAAIIGLTCQMLILPLLCFCIAIVFKLSPELAVGLMLLSASPGGASANLYSHLANGDIALNITLTAVNSVLTLISLPIIVTLSMSYFMKTGEQIPVQFQKLMEVFSLVLVPVCMGMIIKSKFPVFAAKTEKPVKILSAIFLFVVISGAFFKDSDKAAGFLFDVGLAALTLNIVSILVGYYVPLFLKVDPKQAIAIGMEVGIHNGVLAMYVASSVLKNDQMAIPAAVYGIMALISAGVFSFILNKRNKTTT